MEYSLSDSGSMFILIADFPEISYIPIVRKGSPQTHICYNITKSTGVKPLLNSCGDLPLYSLNQKFFLSENRYMFNLKTQMSPFHIPLLI